MRLLVTCIAILAFTIEANSICDKIINYQNEFSARLKALAKSDYFGAFLTAFHHILSSSSKYWPGENLSQFCNITPIYLGGVIFNFSYRPRGCCTICCPINRIEDHLAIHFAGPNRKFKSMKLARKNKIGKLKQLGFNRTSKTVLYVHGFSEDGYLTGTGGELANVYFASEENVNLLLLDYSQLAAIPWYLEAVDNAKLIAQAAAKFIIFYHKSGELPIENLQIIGISLGAHLASHIGTFVGKVRKVPRITGLDPAFPLYPITDLSERMSTNNAEFVDVIHTNPGFYGFPISLGHADFYMQYEQYPAPGCTLGEMIDRNKVGNFLYCDHIRSLMLYQMSLINPYQFPVCRNGTRDSNSTSNTTICGYMGVLASKNTTFGDYFIPRNESEWHAFEILAEEQRRNV